MVNHEKGKVNFIKKCDCNYVFLFMSFIRKNRSKLSIVVIRNLRNKTPGFNLSE